MTWRPTNPNLRTRHGRTQQMDSSTIAGDWTQRTHDLAADEPEPADSAVPNPADGLVEYSRRLVGSRPVPPCPACLDSSTQIRGPAATANIVEVIQ